MASPQVPWQYDDHPSRQRYLFAIAKDIKGKSVQEQVKSKEELSKIHEENLVRIKGSPHQKDTKQIILAHPYWPSTAPFSELSHINIADLYLETHHSGHFLVARTVANPYVKDFLVTIIQDGQGKCCKLSVHHLDGPVLANLLPRGSIVAIKEPYCKVNGLEDFVIRVDHPSDLHVWTAYDERIPSDLKTNLAIPSYSALECRQAGDQAFLARNLQLALQWYSVALKLAHENDDELRNDILRRRANINLAMKRYDAAREDALASCNGSAMDSKAYQCASKASYKLGVFKQSSLYLQSALLLTPDGPALKKDLSRTKQRLQEQAGGDYDLKALSQHLTLENNELDCASFLANGQVQNTAKHGRGLFATRNISAGDIVVAEMAFDLPYRYGPKEDYNDAIYSILEGDEGVTFASGASLLTRLVSKLYNNPSTNAEFLDLHSGGYQRCGKDGMLVDGVPVVDVFLTESIRQKNCFGAPLLSAMDNPHAAPGQTVPMAGGIWTYSSYINHSCIPNTHRSFVGPLQIIRATCDIPAGTEFTAQYIKPDADLAVRHKSQLDCWDFVCDCCLCSEEAKSPAQVRKKRHALFEAIHAEAMGKQSMRKSGIPSATTARAVSKLTHQLESLYEPDIYDKLPRLLLIQPCIWLAETYYARKDASRMLKYALAGLRNFGFVNPLWGDDDEGKKRKLLRKGQVMLNIEAVRMLHYAGEAYGTLGNQEMRDRFWDEARLGYVIITGSEIGIERLPFILAPPDALAS